MDRLLYVWGCSRAGCQRKDGSVRAYRSVKYNARFAEKLERQKLKTKEKEEAKRRAAEEEAAKKKAPNAANGVAAKPNPFSLSSAASGPSNPSFSSPFGSGNLFAAAPSAPPSSTKPNEEEEDSDDSDDDEPPATEEEINELAEALESTTIDNQSATAKSSANAAAWGTAPSFKPLYLSSVSEYLVPEAKPKQLLKNVKVSDGLDDLDAAAGAGGGGGGGGGKWKTETYEKGSATDEIFSRFSKRVVHEGKQCLRYELSGVPLPYHNDSVYKKLFAPTPSTVYNVTRPSQHATTGRSYDPSWIPKCTGCGGPRTFEAQLMPNLITVLKRAEEEGGGEGDGKNKKKGKQQSDVERRNELARVLLKQNTGGGAGSDGVKLGMEWGTCMVFSCLGDCRVGEGGAEEEEVNDCWREEFVLVQWE
ncbi:hypothetical protein M407DRAFT_243928 [Tulasnella calospora MUT 4182]|uniref:Programmed cell death protein 2 C-terminal domain-containing protein n=1 Tax=Tulasnella calospora MUT 4182 TaxID=1051891 RepID=A0A0C3Q813_9AGAM|nr:hypothetical protein M407DRAFT_243928 [Tulasnella calospora MUT 4182]